MLDVQDFMLILIPYLHFLFQIGVVTGVSLAAILGLSFGSLATLFTKDPKVLGIVRTGILV